jgi:hypothetical protein
MTSTLLSQNGKDGARHVDNAPEIGVNLALEFVGRHFLECTDESIAGVVHHDVNASESVDCCGHSGIRVLGRCDVELNRPNAVPVRFDKISQLLWATGGSDDLITCLKYSLGKCASDPARTASDKPDFRHMMD